MPGRNFGYFVHEGLSNLRSHAFMAFASVGVTAACLLLIGTFTLVGLNAGANLDDLEAANEIVAFVKDTYTEEQARAVEADLLAVPNVSSAQFITRQEAMDDFTREHPDEAMFQDLDPGILRDRFALKVDDLEILSDTVALIEAVPGVDGVRVYEEVASGFLTVRSVATLIGAALIGCLLVVSLFIISNTIRLATFDRQDEIAVMRMVGATNSFIRWPFVYEGFFMGLAGAVIAFFLEWGLYTFLARGVTGSDALQIFRVIPFEKLWLPVAGIFLGSGLLIGVGGSLSAIRRFLNV